MPEQITFYSPETFEPWDHRNPDTVGIGGSETSLIEMAHRLARRGHSVTVYAPIPDDTPTPHEGVSWQHIDHADWSRQGLWIVYRAPQIADHFPFRHPGQQLWLVCQDEDYQWHWQDRADRRLKFDRIVALCQAQAEQFQRRYPSSAAAVCQSTNGVRRELVESVLAERLPRDPNRLIYTSSPDRGLAPLLAIFNRLHELNPEVNLHVCYGFDNIDKELVRAEAKFDMLASSSKQWVRQIKRLKEALKGPGITHHGRMPQRALYREIASSSLWVYPTNFRETSPVAGGTPISVVEGEPRSIADLSRASFGQTVLSVNTFGNLQASLATDVRCYRQAAEMACVQAQNVHGDLYQLFLTPDHEVLLGEPNGWWIRRQQAEIAKRSREMHLLEGVGLPGAQQPPQMHDGRVYCPAGELVPGDRVVSLRRSDRSLCSAVVTDVSPAGKHDGYCMNVLPDNNFIAGGIVVHNCITSMEMQALGAIPVVSPLWAVGENVQHGVHVGGDPLGSWLTQARFVGHCARLLAEPEEQARVRAAMMPWAVQRFDYEPIVDQWEGWME